MAMTDAKQEFWGDLQVDLYTRNTALYLAGPELEGVIGTSGYKAHRPIMSHPAIGTYTPYTDITYGQKSSTKQTLTVDTYRYAADEVDITDENQTPYDLVGHSSRSIRNGLMNIVEQEFADEFTNAQHTYSTIPVVVSSTNVADLFEEATGKINSFDAPTETSMRAAVLGPRTIAKVRRAKQDRETGMGDSVLANGVVGAWNGWTVVENNNLPWSATLSIATNPSDGDTVTIAGETFEFQDDLSDVTAGNIGVLRDAAAVATSRANLAACINDSGTAGTNYVQMGGKEDFVIRRKRNITATSAEAMSFTGYGDIAVSSSLTATSDGWSAERQTSIFMVRGAVDLVIQMMELDIVKKEKGFADLVKGMIGIGTKTFDDGAVLMMKVTQDVSGF